MSSRILDILEKHDPAAIRLAEIPILRNLATQAFRARRGSRLSGVGRLLRGRRLSGARHMTGVGRLLRGRRLSGARHMTGVGRLSRAGRQSGIGQIIRTKRLSGIEQLTSAKRLQGDAALKSYADYTVSCMNNCEVDEDRLFEKSYRLGRLVRRAAGLVGIGRSGLGKGQDARSRDDLLRLIEYLYRNIGISLSWVNNTENGINNGTANEKANEIADEIADKMELEVTGCYFSGVYGPEQCRIMSNFDSGVISGILGGGKLVFTERITEGCGRCRACLTERMSE